MCFYQPNKQPCTCTSLNLVRPCSHAEFYPSFAPPPPSSSPSPFEESPLASSAIPLSSSYGGSGGGVLIRPCPNRYITYGAGERYCLKCCRSESRMMGMGVGMMDMSGEEGDGGFGDVDIIPFDSSGQDSSGSHSSVDSGDADDGSSEILPIPPPHSSPPSPTLHKTRPNRFKRQPVSSPVMHLRMKWKRSLIRSAREAAAEAAAEEEARVADAKAKAEAEAEAEAARTVSIPDYTTNMAMAMATAVEDSKSMLAGREVFGLGITVSEDGGWCLSDIPPIPSAGREMFAGSGGRSAHGSYRGVEFSTRVNGFS